MNHNSRIHFENLPFGFHYGAAKVTRMTSNEKKGWVILQIATDKQDIQVYVTRTGKIRVHDINGE